MAGIYEVYCLIEVTTKDDKTFLLRVRYDSTDKPPRSWEVIPGYSLRKNNGSAYIKSRAALHVQPWHNLSDSDDVLLELYDYGRTPAVGEGGEGYHECVCSSKVGLCKWKVKAWSY